MYHWTTIDTIYLYDGSFEGLLTVVEECFRIKKIPRQILVEDEYVNNLFDEIQVVRTNLDTSLEVIKQIRKKISSYSLHYVHTAFLSTDKNRANVIIRYLVYAFKYGKNIDFMKSIDCVIDIQRIAKNVQGEAHRFLGFIRFRELSNKFLYAEYKSDNDILLIISGHFSKRLKNETWMIHDLKRQQVALYNQGKFTIVDSSSMDISSIDDDKEDVYLQLWKEYFHNISIKERENKRCQRQFMPKKYWEYLPEVKDLK